MTVRVTTLPCGMRVATDNIPHVPSVALGVWVAAGTRDEPAERNGIAHLMEHMAFKGTTTRSARDIAEEIESVGGHMNAWTSRESTVFYLRLLADDLPMGIDLLADILRNPLFDEAEFDREREVVLEEIGQAHDTPDDIIFDHFQAVAFPRQPLGRPVLGTVDSITNMPLEALRDYMATHYIGPRMTLVVAGPVDHDRVVAMATEAFAGPSPALAPPHKPPQYTGGEFREYRDLEQVHLLFGFEGVSCRDPDFQPIQVLSTLFGGGMSSRLFQEIREKRGLAYSVYSFASSYTDGGLFGIYAGAGSSRLGELVPLVFSEIARLAGTVEEDEVARARTQLRAGLMMSRESTGSRCEQLAHQMRVWGKPMSTAALLARVDAVDVETVRCLAARIAASPLTCAVLGPAGDLEPYDAITARLG